MRAIVTFIAFGDPDTNFLLPFNSYGSARCFFVNEFIPY